MYCQNCGEQIKQEACYCNKCGRQIQKINSELAIKELEKRQIQVSRKQIICVISIVSILIVSGVILWSSSPNATGIKVAQAYLKAIDTCNIDLYAKSLSKEGATNLKNMTRNELQQELKSINTNLSKWHGEDWIESAKYVKTVQGRTIHTSFDELVSEEVYIQIGERIYRFLIEKHNGRYYVLTTI